MKNAALYLMLAMGSALLIGGAWNLRHVEADCAVQKIKTLLDPHFQLD